MKNSFIIPFTYKEYLTDNPNEKSTKIHDLERLTNVAKFHWKSGGIEVILKAKIRECTGQSLIVGGISADFNPEWINKFKWFIAGTNIYINDYVGTYACGVLYLSKSVNIKVGQYINIKNN